MMTLTAIKAAVEPSEGGVWFKVLVPYSEAQQARQFVLRQKDKPYSVEVKEKREKRSLDANAYFWRLLSDLAEAVGSTKEELYLRYVKDFGPFRDFVLTEDEAKTFRTAWSMLGSGWPTEQVDFTPDGEKVVVRAYYGSSTYNTRQMSRLIDSVVEDCKAVGVETLPPDRLESMKEDWNAQRNKGNGNHARD
jgi:hypothetical protein